MRGLFVATATFCLVTAAPAFAQEATPQCDNGVCQVKVTPAQLLARAEYLVQQRRFSEAQPLIQALALAPGMRLQSRYLDGFSAAEQGNYKYASSVFKGILADDPAQTRVRLELARAMLFLGQTASADRQFAITQQGGDLPPDVARLVRGARDVIRSKRLWRLDMDFGIAPDSNINSATSVNTINVQLGDVTLPVSLNDDARAKSGTGQVGSITAGVRLPTSSKTSLLVDFFGNGTNYEGSSYDDYMIQGSVGPELHLSDTASVSGQFVGAQRWYGGKSISHQFGAKFGGQLMLSDRARVGLQFDGRRTAALFDPNYGGWQLGLYGNIERGISKTFIATSGVFARRDMLKAATYSNVEVGGSLGIAGELPLGFSVGANVTGSRALYDAAMGIFSPDPRKDWRLSGLLSVGNRKLRVMGLSPSVQLSYTKTDSTLALFGNDRLRLRFAVARYF